MTNLHDLIRESASNQERELAGIGRPSLHGRAHRVRVVRHARVAAGATVGAGALAVGAAVALPALWPQDTAAIDTLAPAGSAALPLAADGSLMTAIPANTVVVDLYLDAMCPLCAMFATTTEPGLREIDGATVVYHPVSILDQFSSDGSYSTRAASAIQEVAAGAPDRLGPFLDQLWEHQPPEVSGTLTDAQLTQLALDAGVPADVANLFSEHRYAASVAAATDAATLKGLQGTPTVYVDGVEFGSTLESGWDRLVQQVQAAVEAQKLVVVPQTAESPTAITQGSQAIGSVTPAAPSPTP